jgi:hypothetical protein
MSLPTPAAFSRECHSVLVLTTKLTLYLEQLEVAPNRWPSRLRGQAAPFGPLGPHVRLYRQRVAVIGIGSSGIQIVPKLAKGC